MNRKENSISIYVRKDFLVLSSLNSYANTPKHRTQYTILHTFHISLLLWNLDSFVLFILFFFFELFGSFIRMILRPFSTFFRILSFLFSSFRESMRIKIRELENDTICRFSHLPLYTMHNTHHTLPWPVHCFNRVCFTKKINKL